jgi:hypothetical protein
MEEEEFQSQLMVERHYMIDENESSNPHHDHAHTTTTIWSEEFVEEIVNESSLEDPLEENFAHLEFDLNLDMIHEQAEALLDSTPEIRPKNGETTEISSPNRFSSIAEEEEKEEHLESVEHLEQIEPRSTPNLSNDKEITTEAHSFIPFLLRHFMSPKLQFFNVSKSHLMINLSKDLCTQGHKFRNHLPKKILRSKQVSYLRWRKHSARGLSNFKEERVEGIDWTSQ